MYIEHCTTTCLLFRKYRNIIFHQTFSKAAANSQMNYDFGRKDELRYKHIYILLIH